MLEKEFMNISKDAGKYYVREGASMKQMSASVIRVLALFVIVVCFGLCLPGGSDAAQCSRTVIADVVAIDQPIFYNRLGAVNPAAMIYALRRDVADKSSDLTESEGGTLSAGQVKLRDDKRPRPLVLRVNAGDCLQINFQNLLSAVAFAGQPATRNAGIHVNGMQLVRGIADDGSNVGKNPGSLAAPGGIRTYVFFAEKENTFLLYNPASMTGGEGNGGSIPAGLFGSVNVEPAGAEWYRSQLTEQEMQWASLGTIPVDESGGGGQPVIDYNAVYPLGHRFAGTPILRMLDSSNRIIHSDLNAIITGQNRGRFAPGTYPPNPASPDREQPFREFTTIFHDESILVQPFDIFSDPLLGYTLSGVRDGFAINYGSAAVGPEVVANRIGVGPMWDCTDCKFEEFFLTSWVVGDPAMIVDIPANTKDGNGNLILGPKATKAFYPDDPSNVHHSYLSDHVKFRNLHAGPAEHHIFHLHAHQWLFSPDSDNSNYLDAQHIGPGSGYTYEILYNGSGNRNKTPGDSIYHCHFYPHFAQGMWELWRVHDVFESGTELDVDGLPVPNARALPDGEIAAGTPIPGLVPIPGLPMAPLPALVHIEGGQVVFDEPAKNAGYPFFISADAGHRPPTPPLDLALVNPGDNPMNESAPRMDGGLPRHIILSDPANSTVHHETPLDFNKEVVSAASAFLLETGEPEEVAAMNFHAQRYHATYLANPNPAAPAVSALFETNGLPPSQGAPYAEPCRDDVTGGLRGNPRIYKGANIQLDMVLNKKGWHFPQSRILTLWEDAQPTVNGTRPPQPFVMRGNTNDCITFYHTNLVPNVYEQDDFQVKTPTDVIGQHIHLVKFDVTSADGSANGFNYEDGTLSPDEVRERINAIRTFNNCGATPTGPCPSAAPHPYFGSTFNGRDITGARTTIQKWYVDSLVNNQGVDRGLGNVFTHDHFGPSTHQQAGLFATLLTEPEGSVWRNPEPPFQSYGTRSDGGPTGWAANIEKGAESYREFYLEFADFVQAYEEGGGGTSVAPVPDPARAINPPGRVEVGLPFLFKKAQVCPNGLDAAANGCPTAIMVGDEGTYTVNYRNEPLSLRLFNPSTGLQSTGLAGDPSFAFSSRVSRADSRLNRQQNIYVAGKSAGTALTRDVSGQDPFTPLIRAYENDNVRIRVQVGATEESHIVTVHGIKWLQEYASPNSGYRNAQSMGISEQFQFKTPIIRDKGQVNNVADYLYSVNSSIEGYWNGAWGLVRTYGTSRSDLRQLPNNPIGKSGHNPINAANFSGVCPTTAPVRSYDITAVTAQNALPGGTLVYNPRTTAIPPFADAGLGIDFSGGNGPLHDPTAILYVMTSDLDASGRLLAGAPIEPLILRAAAGDCIQVTLRNELPAVLPDMPGFSVVPMLNENFNLNQLRPSSYVGLHPQLVEYDITKSDGANVGRNPYQTAAPDGSVTYRWYAGDVKVVNNQYVATPAELGGVNLISSDKIRHSGKGALGALVIEPQGSTWTLDPGTRASATVTAGATSFRDFVAVFQTDLNMRFGAGSGEPLPWVWELEDSENLGHKAINYKSDPLWFRLGISPQEPLALTEDHDYTNAFSNKLTGGVDPNVPIFTAKAGTPVRFRVLTPGGHNRNSVFTLHGHLWEREPYQNNSFSIAHNPLSQMIGSQEGIGPGNHFDIVPSNGAGGAYRILGDYLFRDEASFDANQGLWGIFRVTR